MINLKDEVILNLRSVIISKKGGVHLSNIDSDYKALFGVDVPLKTLGYKTLKEFFQNNSDNFTVSETKVQAIQKASSAHIVAMISKQKSQKKNLVQSLRGRMAVKQKIVGNTLSLEKEVPSNDYNRLAKSLPKKKRKRKRSNESNYTQNSWNQNFPHYNNYSGSNSFNPSNSYFINANELFYSSLSYEDLLMKFCVTNRLIIPSFKLAVKKTYYGSKRYYCSITIGDNFLLSSYPSECLSGNEAKELASKKAIYFFYSNHNLKEYYSSGEYVNKLKSACWFKNLSQPVFVSYECCRNQQNRFFISEVKIANLFYSSYPIEAPDENYAQDLAAKRAFDCLNHGFESQVCENKCFF